jgi:hypothetical protein
VTDTVGRINDALCCVVCSKELPTSRVSDDFCRDQCYRDWCEERLRQTQPGESPAFSYEPAWATIRLTPEDRSPVQAEYPSAARSPLRDAAAVVWALAGELLWPWRR